MSERCIDASVVVKLVFKGESYRATARRLLQDCVINSITIIAPPFFGYECDTAVRKRIAAGALTQDQARRAFAGLDKVPVQIVSHPDLRSRSREIAEQFNFRTVYDASYAALAQLRGCEFWTADRAFYEVVKSVLTFVKYLPDYK